MSNKLWSSVQKGTYVGATAYVVGDFVSYNGASYTCILASTGNLPTNATYWALIASKGDTGSTGATGATGSTGPTGPTGPMDGPSSSTDSELPLFDSTTGKLLKRSNTLTGVVRVDSGVVSVDTDVTDIVGAASTTAAGKVEIATGAEVDTGTDDVRAVSPKAIADSAVTTASKTQTLTNKRVTKRVGTTTSHATPTINTDNVDFYSLTAQAEAITSFTTNLSGTPTENQTLWIAITGTAARAITWGASFEASTVALPTTTVTTARLDVGFVWNTVTSKWRCIASA